MHYPLPKDIAIFRLLPHAWRSMNWYYMDNGERKGPVDDNEFGRLANIGQMTADTLVWREGLSDWQPYQAVSGQSAVATSDKALCVECGQVFPTSEMLQYQGSWVCPN